MDKLEMLNLVLFCFSDLLIIKCKDADDGGAEAKVDDIADSLGNSQSGRQISVTARICKNTKLENQIFLYYKR